MQHIDWEDLDEGLSRAIEARTGRVRQVRTISAGHCSQLALSLRTDHGGLFLKGLPERDPGTVRQRREAMINCHVLPLAPRLMWHDTLAGWNLLAFEYIPGARHASYRPGSPDLPDVVAAINRLTRIPCPGLPVKEAPQRWGPYVDDPADARLFDGDRLLHTDFNPLNVLMAPGRTWVIDWAWPTRGAAFIDPACFLIRLIACGHTAEEAEGWAACCDGWEQAPPRAIDMFAHASARLFREIADQDPQPWKRALETATGQWVRYRQSLARSRVT